MTQKEALQNLINSFDNELMAKLFVYNWLEDINWHSEASRFEEYINDYDKQELEDLKDINIVLNPSSYDYTYVSEFIDDKSNVYLVDAVKKARENKTSYVIYNDATYSLSLVREFNKAETMYQTFNYIFGWGTNNNEWNSKGIGIEFVMELLDMIKTHFEELYNPNKVVDID